MPKPIFTVGLPVRFASKEKLDLAQKAFKSTMPDYHVLVYPTVEEDTQFKAFYEKDFDDIKFEELKSLVSAEIQKLKTN